MELFYIFCTSALGIEQLSIFVTQPAFGRRPTLQITPCNDFFLCTFNDNSFRSTGGGYMQKYNGHDIYQFEIVALKITRRVIWEKARHRWGYFHILSAKGTDTLKSVIYSAMTIISKKAESIRN